MGLFGPPKSFDAPLLSVRSLLLSNVQPERPPNKAFFGLLFFSSSPETALSNRRPKQFPVPRSDFSRVTLFPARTRRTPFDLFPQPFSRARRPKGSCHAAIDQDRLTFFFFCDPALAARLRVGFFFLTPVRSLGVVHQSSCTLKNLPIDFFL